MRVILLFSIAMSTLFSSVKVGDQAPTFFAYTLDGGHFFLSDSIKKERPIVLSFFATWCIPCIQEIPVIDSISTVYSDVDFYLVNVSGLVLGDIKRTESKKDVQKLISRLDTDLPVLLDKWATIATNYGALQLPRIVLINSQGKVDYLHTGYAPGDEKKLINILDSYNSDKK